MRQAAAELEAIRRGKTPGPEGAASEIPTAGQDRRVSPNQDRRVSPGQVASKDDSLIQIPLHLLDLPAQTTPLIGREADLAHLLDLLANPQCRLVTLVGTGGIGKTRLAIEAAARAAKDLSSGAVFVPLAPVSEMQIISSRPSPMPCKSASALGQICKEQLLQRVSGSQHAAGAG